MKIFKSVALMAAIISTNSMATDLSVGAATSGDLQGFTLKLGGDSFIGSFTYTSEDMPKNGTLDNTTLTLGYKIPVAGGLQVYPLAGAGFYTFHDNTGKSESDSGFVYGAGVRYTFDSGVLVDYTIQADDHNNVHAVSVGYEFN